VINRCLASLTIAAVAALIPQIAFAKVTVIAELGTAPLLGTSSSTAQLRQRVARNEGVLSAAAARLGLNNSQYAQFRAAIDGSRLAWVTVPRHLDAMTWQGAGRVYVLRDVMIPAGTHGWEVDLPANGQVLSLYMPALCGNLSILRKSVPVVAHRAARVETPVVVVPPPAPVPPPVAVAPPPPPVVAAPPPAPPPAAVAETEFPPVAAVAAVHHGFSLLPLLFGLGAISGGASSSGGGPAPIAACP
jgi:hypothetical protein